MNILVLNTLNAYDFEAFFPEPVRKRLESLGNVRYLPYSNTETERRELKEIIRDVDVMFTGWGASAVDSGFDAEFYANAKKLKMMIHTGGSVANLVTEDMCQRENFALLSANHCMAELMAQGVLCYILVGQKWLYPVLKATEKSGWVSSDKARSLLNRTVGIVGFGMIAKEVIRLLQVFKCKIKVYSDYEVPQEEKAKYPVTFCSLEEVFRTSDVITIHLGMTPEHYHIVDETMLNLMKEDALLVNTARGAIIDEAALEKVVKTGRIRAVLDVFEVEPLPMDSGLRGLDNVIISPHSVGRDNQNASITMRLIDDIERFYRGERTLENQISMDYAKHMTSHSLVVATSRKKQAN